MRKPLPGEKASGVFEEALQAAGLAEFKLEPHEIEYVGRELRRRLEAEVEKMLEDDYPEEKQ